MIVSFFRGEGQGNSYPAGDSPLIYNLKKNKKTKCLENVFVAKRNFGREKQNENFVLGLVLTCLTKVRIILNGLVVLKNGIGLESRQ